MRQIDIKAKKYILASKKRVALTVTLCFFVCLLAFCGLFAYSLLNNAQYRLADLKAKQEGVNICLTWKDADAAGYKLILFKKKSRPKAYDANSNRIAVEAKELGIQYRYMLLAKSPSGGLSAARFGKISTHKLKQQIETEKDEYFGIKGKEGALIAKAHGRVAYKSNKPSVMRVDKSGKMFYNNEGNAEVTLRVEEGPQYLASKKAVSVTVYPDRLAAPKPEVSYDSGQTAKISWKPVKYAKNYELAKYNPVSKQYEKIGDFDGETTSVTVIREPEKYRIVAKTELEGEKIESDLSSDAEIVAPAEELESYRSSHILRTLDLSTCELITKVSGKGKANVPQSMSLVNGQYFITFVDKAGKKGVFVAYDRNGNHLGENPITGMGHANGSTYNPNTDKIYTVKTHKAIWSPSCTTYKVGDGFVKENFNLPKNTSGIAYDKTEDRYFLSKGNELYITDKDFKITKAMRKFIRYNHSQDIAAYNGVFFVCTWVSGNQSYIDLYRASDSAYLGSYNVPFGEIESCFVDVDAESMEKHLIILMNNAKKHGDCLMRVKDPINL